MAESTAVAAAAEMKAMGATNEERSKRLQGILATRSGAPGEVRSQSTADEAVERDLAGKVTDLLDFLLPHIQQVQERQSIEEHGMQFLEECIQALR